MNGAVNVCHELTAGLGQLFQCEPVAGNVRIRTPFLYPDGDYIDLFFKAQDSCDVFTDFGETTRWLKNQTISAKRSIKQQAMIEDVCVTHGVEFFRGMLLARVQEPRQISEVVLRLAQACLRVADLYFTFRARSGQAFNEDVADFLSQKEVQFLPSESLAGRSGKSWTIDFHTRTAKRSALILTLSTSSQAAARRVVEHVVAAWYDLNHLKVGPEALGFISLFDDTADVWRDEDFRLVDDLSQVARWSDSNQFYQLVTAA